MGDGSRFRTPLHFAAFACFTATTLVFSPNTSIFSGMGMGGENMGAFIFPMFIAACVVSGICAAGLRHQDAREYRKFALLAVAAIIHIGCAGIVVACNYGSALSVPLIRCAGALYGASLVILCLAWANILGRLAFRQAILYASVVCLASYALSFLLGFAPQSIRWLPYMVLFCTGSVVPLAILRKEAKADESAASEAADASGNNGAESRGGTGDLLATLRLPALGLLLFAFLMALGKVRLFDAVEIEHAAGTIAALCFLPLFAVKTDLPVSSFIYRIIAPTIGGIVIVVLAASGQSGDSGLAFTCVYVFLSALAILAFANVLAIINAGEFSAEFIASLGLFAGCAVSLAGVIWSQLFGGPDNVFSLMTVLIAVYCAGMMIYLGWEAWTMMHRPEEERAEAPAPSGDWRTRAEAAKLSKREIEILSYLGRGHSAIYIAEQLFISESTVRTHAKHIYAKLDIHSKEELFAFFDGTTRAN